MAKQKAKVAAKSLSELLAEANALWNMDGHFRPGGTYDFTLGKFPEGWRFNVVNSWQRWHSANRNHNFGDYPTPEQAVQAFLDYVKEHRISVEGLSE